MSIRFNKNILNKIEISEDLSDRLKYIIFDNKQFDVQYLQKLSDFNKFIDSEFETFSNGIKNNDTAIKIVDHLVNYLYVTTAKCLALNRKTFILKSYEKFFTELRKLNPLYLAKSKVLLTNRCLLESYNKFCYYIGDVIEYIVCHETCDVFWSNVLKNCKIINMIIERKLLYIDKERMLDRDIVKGRKK